MERFRFLVSDSFYGAAKAIRRRFDGRLGEAREPFDPKRFFWESWQVPGQFAQLRTPAQPAIGKDVLDPFEAHLVKRLTTDLGVVSIASPLWLSSLVDGLYQGLHRDSPNGDFAFSFGLGREGKFRGGETLLARDEMLDYFGTGAHRDREAASPLFDEVPSRFNRIVVFDARLPHGVRHVEGPRDPKEGRAAIQGWLRVRGVASQGMPEADARVAITRALSKVYSRAAEGLVIGDLRKGKFTLRTHTLAATAGDRDGPRALLAEVGRALSTAKLPHSAKLRIGVRIEEGKAKLADANESRAARAPSPY